MRYIKYFLHFQLKQPHLPFARLDEPIANNGEHRCEQKNTKIYVV